MTRLSLIAWAFFFILPFPAFAGVTLSSGTLGDRLVNPETVDWWTQLVSQLVSWLT